LTEDARTVSIIKFPADRQTLELHKQVYKTLRIRRLLEVTVVVFLILVRFVVKNERGVNGHVIGERNLIVFAVLDQPFMSTRD